MTKTEQRQIAAGAARSIMRRAGMQPISAPADDALIVLDDLTRSAPDTIAAQWYLQASDNQIALFRREWRDYARKRAGMI